VLTLKEKLKLLESSEFKSQKKLASEFGVSVGSVNKILKRKVEYETLGEENCNPQLKRVKVSTTHTELNILVWQWFATARSKKKIVTGPPDEPLDEPLSKGETV
jgi:hypothetical protein